ncbi:MAG: hypothetical protein AAGM22_25530, partial [Acidobacteriota bacterium]
MPANPSKLPQTFTALGRHPDRRAMRWLTLIAVGLLSFSALSAPAAAEHPDCAGDSWSGCSESRLQIEAAYYAVNNPDYPPTQANFDDMYLYFKLYVDLFGIEQQTMCRLLLEYLVPSPPAQGHFDDSRSINEYNHICGWQEDYVDSGVDLAIWLDAEDFNATTGRWPGKLGTPEFEPSSADGSYAFQAPTLSGNDLLGRAGVFFDGAHMLKAEFESHAIGDTFTSVAVYRPESDSADTEEGDTGITDSIWTEIGPSRSNPRHETSLHVGSGDVVIEIVEATRLDGDQTRVLKWRNGELVASEVHAFHAEAFADTFDAGDERTLEDWLVLNNDNSSSDELYGETNHQLAFQAGPQDDHLAIPLKSLNSIDRDIRVDVAAMPGDTHGRFYLYLFWEGTDDWIRLAVNDWLWSHIERKDGSSVSTLCNGTGVDITPGEPLKAWHLTADRSGAIRFTSDGETMLECALDPPLFGDGSAFFALGGDSRRPIWDNFRLRVDESVNFNLTPPTSYAGGQDHSGTVRVEDNGSTLYLDGNRWQKIELPSPLLIQENTILEFDFESTVAGEIHAIGFDSDNALSEDRAFTVFNSGVQNPDWGIQSLDFAYSGTGTMHISIPVGQSYSGVVMNYLFFANDDDLNLQSNSRFSNVRIRHAQNEGLALGCDHVVSDGAGQWDGHDCSRFTLGELLVYDRAISDWERSNLERSLAAKWGLDLANKDRALRCLADETAATDYDLLAFHVLYPDSHVMDDIAADCETDVDHPDLRRLRDSLDPACHASSPLTTVAVCLGSFALMTETGGRAGSVAKPLIRKNPGLVLAACGLGGTAVVQSCINSQLDGSVEVKKPQTSYQPNETEVEDHGARHHEDTGPGDRSRCALNETGDVSGHVLVDELTAESPRDCCVAMVPDGGSFTPQYVDCERRMPILCNVLSSDGDGSEPTYSNYIGRGPDFVQVSRSPLQPHVLNSDVACISSSADRFVPDGSTSGPIEFGAALWLNFTSETAVYNDFDSIAQQLVNDNYPAVEYGLGGFGDVTTCAGTQSTCQNAQLTDAQPLSTIGSNPGNPGRKRSVQRDTDRIAKRFKFENTSRTDQLKRTHNALTVHTINVGQGSCHLLQCSQYNAQGEHVHTDSVVFDCGTTSRGPLGLSSLFAAGYMRYNHFDASSSPLYVSHGDADHWSALPRIYFDGLPPVVNYAGSFRDYGDRFRLTLQRAIRANPAMSINGGQNVNTTWSRDEIGQRLERFGACQASIDLLSVNATLADRQGGNLRGYVSPRERNAVSAVLGVSADSQLYSAILPGDAVDATEADVAAADKASFSSAQVSLLLSSHHGADSYGSNGQGWLDA